MPSKKLPPTMISSYRADWRGSNQKVLVDPNLEVSPKMARSGR
jgi:hypothetical protein